MRFHSPVTPLPLEPGKQLHFAGDPNPWHVSAVSDNFAMCCRRFAGALGGAGGWPEVIYTVLDWRRGVRGISDARPNEAPRTQTECAQMLAEFETGELEVSHRNRVRIEFGEVAG